MLHSSVVREESERALVEAALQLDERRLRLDDGLTRVIDGAHDVDELRELLDDLLKRLGIARAGDRHAREHAVVRRQP